MVRSAAKNHKDVAIVVNASDYAGIVEGLKAGGLTYAQRFDLMLKAFTHRRLRRHDRQLHGHHRPGPGHPVHRRPQRVPAHLQQPVRQGPGNALRREPAPERGVLREAKKGEAGIATATQLQGKELSYNNMADTDAALECVKSFVKPACVIVKHANPCGVAVVPAKAASARPTTWPTPPTPNRPSAASSPSTASWMANAAIVERQFVEVIIAPKITQAARDVVAAKQNVRLLECGEASRACRRLGLQASTAACWCRAATSA
jgi:phosphoribosylaminoimidazolecarboxamide formyltransferase/IMP cyclohydrolase